MLRQNWWKNEYRTRLLPYIGKEFLHKPRARRDVVSNWGLWLKLVTIRSSGDLYLSTSTYTVVCLFVSADLSWWCILRVDAANVTLWHSGWWLCIAPMLPLIYVSQRSACALHDCHHACVTHIAGLSHADYFCDAQWYIAAVCFPVADIF